jgi:O-antigen/teichoic acid export membrane protein
MTGRSPNFAGLINKAIPVGLGMAFLFLGQAFLARLMGPGSFGTYSYFMTWITVAALLAKAGHEWVLLKAVPGRIRFKRPGEIRFLVVRAVKAVALRAAFAASILIVLALAVGRDRGLNIYVMTAGSLLIVALAIAEIRRALALAYGAIWIAETPENIVKSVFLVLIAAALALSGGVSPDAMLWANLIVTFLASSMAALIFIRLRARDILSSAVVHVETREHDDLMRSMWVTNFLNIFLRNADVLIIGALTDFASTGIYIAATRVASLAAAPVMVLDRIVAPPIAEAAELGDHARLTSSSWEYAILSTVASFALVVFIGGWGSHFISILFGNKYEDALILTWILLIGHAANALTGPTGVLLSMAGSHRILVLIAGIGAVIYVALLYLLVPQYLVVGAATAFAITHTAKAIMQVFFVRRRLGINPTIFRLPRIR